MRNDLVLLDGAVGTSLWEKTEIKVPVWRYNIENPKIVRELIREYVSSGAEYILSNTFGANRTMLKKSEYTVSGIVGAAMRIISEELAGTGCKKLLSVGPLAELLEPYGDLTEDEAYEMFDEVISAGVTGGADIIYVQTFTDLEMGKIALRAARKHDLPLFCSFSFDGKGRTMMGNSVSDIINGTKEYSPDAIGLNCSLGPDAAVNVIKEFSSLTDTPLIFKPNAGKSTISDVGVVHEYTADIFVKDSLPALEYNVKYIGGCCGSNPEYISALCNSLKNLGYKSQKQFR